MANTSSRPITVDGVRLDTLGWNVLSYTRTVSGRRTADQEAPGIDGVLPSLNDNLEAAAFGIQMLVRGTDTDGLIPAAGSLDTYRANLDELVHLFGKRHALLDVQQQVDSAGTMRRAWAKVVDTITPEQNTPGHAAQFTVGMVLPYGVWEDVATQDWTTTTTGAAVVVTPLTGATERITDAIVLVKGPCAAGVKVTDNSTGAYVSLDRALSSTELWRVNVGTWSSRYGAGLTLASADTAGTDAAALTTYGGTRNQAAFLPMVPVRASASPGAARQVGLVLSGTGFTAGTSALSVRARRKFAL